jgi:hypothetical protein
VAYDERRTARYLYEGGLLGSRLRYARGSRAVRLIKNVDFGQIDRVSKIKKLDKNIFHASKNRKFEQNRKT